MSNAISRRRFFFYGSLLAGAVPTGGYGSVPSLQALGFKSAMGKLNVAAIGCGGQGGLILGQAALTENLIALCDVDHGRAAGTFKKFEATPKYKDFRVMLDKEGKNIDACTIGVPDFMHATVALACMQRGKHVYVEKPLTRTPWEARLLQDAAVKYKVATQMGNQGFSHEAHRVAAEIVWSGEIGDVTEAHVSTSPGMFPTGLTEPPPESAVPSSLDWDLWLGGAAPRPFSDAYVPYNWRGFLDFGTGQIGNWATHTAGPVHTALKLGTPVSVECLRIEGKSTISMPHRAVVRLDFPARAGMPPVSVYYHEAARPGDPEAYVVPGMENETILPPSNNLRDKGRETSNRAPALGEAPAGGRGAQPQAPPAGPRRVMSPGGPDVKVYTQPGGRNDTPTNGVLTGNGSVMVGSKGMLATRDRGEGVWLLPAARWKEYALPPQVLTRSPGHMADWVRACKGGDRSCSDFAITAPYAEWLALVVIAWRVPGKLQWDSKNTRFTNSEEANRWVKPMFRKGWDLKL
jgi:hypothetical protein